MVLFFIVRRTTQDRTKNIKVTLFAWIIRMYDMQKIIAAPIRNIDFWRESGSQYWATCKPESSNNANTTYLLYLFNLINAATTIRGITIRKRTRTTKATATATTIKILIMAQEESVVPDTGSTPAKSSSGSGGPTEFEVSQSIP